MDPNTALNTALSTIFTGALVYLLVSLGLVLIGFYISYRIIKAGVRDGVTEALRRNGVADALSKGTPYVQGYPPAQPYSAAVPYSTAVPMAQQPPYAGQDR